HARVRRRSLRRRRQHRRIRGPPLPGQLEPRGPRAPPGPADLPRRTVAEHARAGRRDRRRRGPLALLARLRARRRRTRAPSRVGGGQQDAGGFRDRRGGAAGDLGRRPGRAHCIPRRAFALPDAAVLPRHAAVERPRQGAGHVRQERRGGRAPAARSRRRRRARRGAIVRPGVPRRRCDAARDPTDHLPRRAVVSPYPRGGFALVAGAALVVALLATACATERPADFPPPRSHAARLGMLPADRGAAILYVALGDSTVEGVGASSRSRNYVSRLHERLRAGYPAARRANLGAGGATSADVRARQLDRAIELHPQLVTLAIGPNDITTEVPLAAYAQ